MTEELKALKRRWARKYEATKRADQRPEMPVVVRSEVTEGSLGKPYEPDRRQMQEP